MPAFDERMRQSCHTRRNVVAHACRPERIAFSYLLRVASCLVWVSLISGCISDAIGNGGAKFMNNVNERAGDTAEKVVTGARNALTNDETKRKLIDLEGMLVAGLRDPLTSDETLAKLRALEHQLLTDFRQQLKETEQELFDRNLYDAVGRLREELIGAKTLGAVERLRDAIVGTETQAAMTRIVGEAVGESLKERVGALREELIGAPARLAVEALINETMKNVGEQFDLHVKSRIRSEEAELQRRVTRIIWTAVAAGVVLLAAIGFVLHRLKMYRSIINLLTTKIDAIRVPTTYDQLTSAVSERAKEEGLEPLLRRVLVEQGINDNDQAERSAA